MSNLLYGPRTELQSPLSGYGAAERLASYELDARSLMFAKPLEAIYLSRQIDPDNPSAEKLLAEVVDRLAAGTVNSAAYALELTGIVANHSEHVVRELNSSILHLAPTGGQTDELSGSHLSECGLKLDELSFGRAPIGAWHRLVGGTTQCPECRSQKATQYEECVTQPPSGRAFLPRSVWTLWTERIHAATVERVDAALDNSSSEAAVRAAAREAVRVVARELLPTEAAQRKFAPAQRLLSAEQILILWRARRDADLPSNVVVVHPDDWPAVFDLAFAHVCDRATIDRSLDEIARIGMAARLMEDTLARYQRIHLAAGGTPVGQPLST